MVVAMEIGSAAVLRYLGHDASRCLFHHEYAPTRKIDPAGPNTRIALRPGDRSMRWVGDSFRARVTSWLEPAPPPPIPEEDDDMGVIITNAEEFFGGPPGQAKFLLLEDGKLRWIKTIEEWAARGSKPGIPWTNAQIATAGVAG